MKSVSKKIVVAGIVAAVILVLWQTKPLHWVAKQIALHSSECRRARADHRALWDNATEAIRRDHDVDTVRLTRAYDRVVRECWEPPDLTIKE
jgi:hypothetical protein